MIKVLIAEDEKPLLRGIRQLIEEIDPQFTVVKCAVNGKEAIEYSTENHADVIFTDINMPLVDGFEVIKFAKEHQPETVIVIISGYNDFTYAQKAIRFGVKEYLLKPIVKKDLAGILERISDHFKKNRLDNEKSRIQDAVYLGKKGHRKEDFQEETVRIAYFCAGPFIKEGLEESIFECDLWHGIDVEQAVCKILPENSHVYCFEKYQANERIVLMVTDEKVNMKDFAEEFVSAMKEQKIQVTAAYYPAYIRLGEIPDISRKLRKKIQLNIRIGEETVVCGVLEEYETKRSESTLKQEITGKSIEVALKEFEALMSRKHILQEECRRWLITLLKRFMPGDGENDDQIDEMIQNLFLYSADSEELTGNLRQMMDEKRLYKKESTTADIMRDMEEYIKKHVAEPVTASVLADEFGLVAPYLSKLFKEYSGYSPAQYIQKMRIDQAKSLLESDRNFLAKDVAEMVGYPNPLYFSKVFKKNVGVYPSEYRRQYQNRKGQNNEI